MILVLKLLLDFFHVGDCLELVAILQMLLLDPQQVPNSSSHDLYGSSNEGKQLRVTEIKRNAGRDGHHPRKTHDKVHNNDYVVISLGFEGQILPEQPILSVRLQQTPIVLQIPKIRINGGDG